MVTPLVVKTKIIESAASEITKIVILLLLPLLSGLVLAIVPPVRDRILPGLPKPLLAVLVGLSLSLNLALFLYVRRLRNSLNQKMLPRFGVLWTPEHVPHCPACSKVVAYVRQSMTWGFQCVQCSRFIPLNDDDGRSIKIADAKILLSGKQIEEPELDDIDMRILTLFAEPDSVVTPGQVAAALNMKAQHAKHRLSELTKRRYIYPSTVWTSTDAPYHLTDEGRSLIVSRKLI